jgi:hypothetical protein
MTVRDWIEQLWFAVGIAGFLIFLEEALIYFVTNIFHKKIPKEVPRMVAGLAIFALALYKLFTLPPA